jgi:hypothetical protein
LQGFHAELISTNLSNEEAMLREAVGLKDADAERCPTGAQ